MADILSSGDTKKLIRVPPIALETVFRSTGSTDRSRISAKISQAPLAHEIIRANREAMNIGITGASGFLGRHVIQDALTRGHRVTPFSRRLGKPIPGCQSVRSFGPDVDLSGIEAIIHLAGESILGLWTKEKRNKILRSRIDGTRWIVDAIGQTRNRPSVLVSASGTGIYGNRGEETLTEASPASSAGFLAEVATAWEAEGSKAEASGVRYVAVRIALVLGKGGGAIPLMKTVFQAGLGGKLGSG